MCDRNQSYDSRLCTSLLPQARDAPCPHPTIPIHPLAHHCQHYPSSPPHPYPLALSRVQNVRQCKPRHFTKVGVEIALGLVRAHKDDLKLLPGCSQRRVQLRQHRCELPTRRTPVCREIHTNDVGIGKLFGRDTLCHTSCASVIADVLEEPRPKLCDKTLGILVGEK